jgi:hypothetical protein
MILSQALKKYLRGRKLQPPPFVRSGKRVRQEAQPLAQ